MLRTTRAAPGGAALIAVSVCMFLINGAFDAYTNDAYMNGKLLLKVKFRGVLSTQSISLRGDKW